MSPYRILAKNSNGEYKILVSMFSKNPETGEYNIYIQERVPNDNDVFRTPSSWKDIAHRISTRKNSKILGRYIMCRDSDDKHYRILHVDCGANQHLMLPNQYILQSECLVAAMENHLRITGSEFQEIL